MKILMRADTHYSIGRVVEYEEPKFTLSQVRLIKDNCKKYSYKAVLNIFYHVLVDRNHKKLQPMIILTLIIK